MLNARLQLRFDRTVKEINSVLSPEITTPEEALQFLEELYDTLEGKIIALREELGIGSGDGR